MANVFENPKRINYFHEQVKEHLDDLAEQAKNPREPRVGNGERGVPMQRVAFDSKHIDLFNAALNDPNHPNRRAAENAMRGFARTVEKPKGMSINAAARELNVPQRFLWSWAREKGIIPILVEGSGSGSNIIIDWEKAREAAEFYHEAKQQHIQPIKLYQRKYPKQI
jgi:hypothetical protein